MSPNEEIINRLCQEVSDMNLDGQRWLNQLWRDRTGHIDAMASVIEMAECLARHRGIIDDSRV